MRRKLTPGEVGVAEIAEHAMAEAPEAAMRRRDFLSRTAVAAGLAGAAASLPLNLLIGEAAKREARAAGLPTPANMPVDHFGWLPNADGVQDRTYLDPDNGGAPVSTRHASAMGDAQWQGCGHPDPDH